MNYEWNFAALARFRGLFLQALGTTISLSIAVIITGMALGLLLTMIRRSSIPVLPWVAVGFIEVVRAVPPLVLLVWIYYCMPILLGFGLSNYHTTVLSLSLYSAAFYSEIFRAGAQSIDRGLVEAGLSVGMNRVHILGRIVGPLAFQRVLPPFVSQCILVIKNTSLGGYIAVQDLLYQGQRVTNEIFRPLEVLTTVALIYIALIVPLSVFANIHEKAYRKRYGL